MKQEEYIKTIIFNGCMINIGLDDYGQTYFIEYVEDGELKEECVGAYVTDYEDYIEYRFGDPEINCPIYHNVATSATNSCKSQTMSLCSKCRKSYSDVAWENLQLRREEFEKYFKEKQK